MYGVFQEKKREIEVEDDGSEQSFFLRKTEKVGKRGKVGF